MQSISDALTGLICSIGWLLAIPTVMLLLLRRFAPAFGDPLWQAYLRFLAWLVMAPFRLVGLLLREVTGRRRS